MNGMLVAILAQSMLLFGTSAGFNQPTSAGSTLLPERLSTEIVQKDIALKPGGLILLDTDFGNISVEEYDGSDVKVELSLRGTPEGISNFRFTHNYFGSQVTLRGWYENGSGRASASLRKVDFVVKIPRGSTYAVRATTRQGNISAAISGNMLGVELLTEAGSVNLELPADLAANLDLTTSELGRVNIESLKAFEVICPDCEIRQNDRLKVRMNGGGASVSAHSGIGNVYLEIVPQRAGKAS